MKRLGQIGFAMLLLSACSRNTTNTGQDAATAFAKYPASEGKTIFQEKCSRCHKYRMPETRTAEAWGPIMNRMARKARLDDSQKAAVLAFVKEHAKS
ncbi:hypothetical protein MKQ70_30740 [Chitinophaga sedimenti]|uniref:hypothetical protein n=1 Tax=Chitinophaga sedimenti TaxID=2033606 RepID=UPI0020031068|nr:hypothetical protein [Chitinophaga sedimenti]MCK7559117.1 hypothetical protein [Chitinophaga sedimenti]